MAARTASKVSPGDDTKDVEADDTKAEAAPLGTMPHAPTLHHLATREPHSFHQTTIYYGLVRPDTPPRRKYGLLAASIGIVFLQCFVATGLSVGVSLSTCSDNQDCTRGTYCEQFSRRRGSKQGICEWCESEYKHCCHSNSTKACPAWAEKVKEPMCANCVTDTGFEAFAEVAQDRIDSMGAQDWVTLFLASLVVAFAVFAEIRDAILCEIALRAISRRRDVPRGWRFAIRGLNAARYYIFLPNVVSSVVQLVLNDGGDVKNVCLNTVAVLFLLEVDNLAFLHGLGERTRMEAEEMTGARVTEDELQTINAAKIVCILGVPGVVLAGLLGGRYVLKNWPGVFSLYTAPLPFMVILFLQRVKASRRKLKGACGALGWGLAGYIMYLLWYVLVTILIYVLAH